MCEFCSEEDFARHLDAFGRNSASAHLLKFQKLHESVEEDSLRVHGGADRVVWDLVRIINEVARV